MAKQDKTDCQWPMTGGDICAMTISLGIALSTYDVPMPTLAHLVAHCS